MDIFAANYCRFCLKEAQLRRKKFLEIDKQIEESFYELTQIKLSNHSIFTTLSNQICDDCCKNLTLCVAVRQKFIESQIKLEEKAKKSQQIAEQRVETSTIFLNKDFKIELDDESVDDNFDYNPAFDEIQDEDEAKPVTDDKISKFNSKTKTTSPNKKQCTLCGSLVKNLKEHLKYTHNQVQKNYYCDHCTFSCYFRHKMELHVQKHIPKASRNLLSCPNCDYLCGRKDSLTKHIHSVHQENREKKIHCNECDKAYFNVSSLNNHIRTVHRNIRNFECLHCHKKFYTVKDLNLHVPRHFEKKEKCPLCGLLFFTQHEVRAHNRRIHLPPTIKCTYDEQCDKMFTTREKLKMHISVRHEKLKNFMCVKCGAAFAQYNTLTRHMDTVHKSLRVQCPVDNCEFSMKRKERFMMHLNRYHADLSLNEKNEIIKSLKYVSEDEKEHIRAFPCPDCGKVFTKYHNLKNHIKKGHVKRIYPLKIIHCPVDDCTYKVSRKNRFKLHLVKSHQHIDDDARELILKNVK